MSKKTDTKAEASDKALATTTGMTNAQMIEALSNVGVTAPKKAVKADLEKLMNENAASLALMERLAENKKLCLIKSFGAHGTSGICPKCKKTQKGVYSDCSAYMTLKGIKKAASSKKRKMGHRTGNALWGTRKTTYANRYCRAILDAGEAGMSMTEVRKAKWNPKSYSFNETTDRLVKEKLVTKADGRITVTALGLETSGKKKAA